MAAREWLEQHRAAATAAVVVVLAGSLGWLYYQSQPGGTRIPTKAYFYDLETGLPFEGPISQVPPVPAPSGKTVDGSPVGVRAYVYTCSSCSKEADRFIGYLETSSEDAKVAAADLEKFENGQPTSTGAPGSLEDYQRRIDEGHQVAKPDKPITWVTANSHEGALIVLARQSRCPDGKPATECFPK